jgi:hypothetical protein
LKPKRASFIFLSLSHAAGLLSNALLDEVDVDDPLSPHVEVGLMGTSIMGPNRSSDQSWKSWREEGEEGGEGMCWCGVREEGRGRDGVTPTLH